ncbi:MFS transporter [Bordetella sp. N]|uniref:MFS transporter n=1 Tax=Bordetella sp. N TaxID=1746199 RepID=UPI00070E4050|nr:MFS transporter [Bordetella sp. N]ALM82437.1 MFS transporter [Bordetella sp. N]
MTKIDIPLRSPGRIVFLIAGLLLIASNLRAPVTGLAPILGVLQAQFALSPAQAGMLTTLPLLAFGFISPFAALLAREYGLERTLFAAMWLVAGGLLVRSIGPLWCLYLGTAISGSGIAVGNVLMPSLVKRDFPARVPLVMGACALTMGGIAALVSGCIVPLTAAWGWQGALAATILFPLAAVAVWTTQLRAHTGPARDTATPPHGGTVWHSALAWQVTLFMGFNSLLYYVLISWLPAILADAGYTPAEAGAVHGGMQFAAAVPGIVLAPLVGRMKDQTRVAAAMGLMMAVGLLGLLFVPAGATAWALLYGFGSGGGILLALIFMGLRAANARQAAALSGMAQCVGYLLAACGPALVGKLHTLTGAWTLPLAVGVALSLAMAGFGALAGRARQIGDVPTVENRMA